MHGIYLIISLITQPLRKQLIAFIGLEKHIFLHKIVQSLITFFLAAFAWIFFRASNLGDALYITTHLFTGISNGNYINELMQVIAAANGLYTYDLYLSIMLIGILIIIEIIQRKIIIRELIDRRLSYGSWIIYYIAIFTIIIWGEYFKIPFIYFQF